ncbi:hypothetical protein MW290_28005 [Aquincola tertiaricarbonis]|uniref:Uncharacterized protein n=1 Tax=Aquincola tertiaricarbonis TaxID=391953 RepID=A0ABY4SEH5_AQUTE|nr:hypothetical protein [Aquincola tertiaricarbonis]URI09411.1 hypothetical protein MW290_28005 [Aquincola tertiaricarbonis]
MSTGSKSPRASIWQAVTVVQEFSANLLVAVVPASDPDLPFFIADGDLTVAAARHGRDGKAALAMLAAQRPLLGQLTCLLLARRAFPVGTDEGLRVHCHSVAVDAARRTVSVVASLVPGDSAVPKALRDAAIVCVTRERAAEAQAAARWAVDEIHGSASPGPGAAGAAHQRRALDITPLLELMPPGFSVRLNKSSVASADRAITKAILAAPDPVHPPPRDGQYRALIVDAGAGQRLAVVTWLPHRGDPSYGEVRAAAERRVPRAFVSPRQTGVYPPLRPAGSHDGIVHDASPFDPADPAWLGAFDQEAVLDLPQPQAAADRSRVLQGQVGFEAIAWYQPHHTHGESAWGIYFDAANLDDFIGSLSLDLQREGFGRSSDALAAKLGVGLVYEHVLFHAQVEAALTWMELQAGHAKFIPFQTRVSTAVRGTDDWLEEALANFWAWSWLRADSMLAMITGVVTGGQHAALERIVQATLDRSPAGHRRWRDGRQREPWRILATQAVTGKPTLPPPGIGLPLEPTLRGPLPFDFRPTDVPLRFVGASRVTARLLRMPAARSGYSGKV